MNFGWLKDDTDAVEYERVVVHEFGDALGAIYEHQISKRWDRMEFTCRLCLFCRTTKSLEQRRILNQNAIGNIRWISSMRHNSILINHALSVSRCALIKGGRPTKLNTKMSRGDKRFIKTTVSIINDPRGYATHTYLACSGWKFSSDYAAAGRQALTEYVHSITVRRELWNA